MLHHLVNYGLNIIDRSPMRNKHVCFVVKNRCILTMAVNDYAMQEWSIHAEESALFDGLLDGKFKGANIFVFRYKKDVDGRWTVENSRPCKNCVKVIKRAGIKKVYYSVKTMDGRRGIEVIKVKDLISTFMSTGQIRKKCCEKSNNNNNKKITK